MTETAEAETRMREALDALGHSFPERAVEVRRLLEQGGFTAEEAARSVRFGWGRPGGVPDGYPTFGGTARPLSPLLSARFRLAGTLNDLAWKFPTAARVGSVHRSRAVRDAYRAHAENWAGSAPMRLSADRLSIAAIISAEDGSVAYFVWSDAIEPEVLAYAEGHERRHRDLAAFLEWLGGPQE
ncbi:hypothetical protein RHDE110596_16390 [Prescottella defluvii]